LVLDVYRGSAVFKHSFQDQPIRLRSIEPAYFRIFKERECQSNRRGGVEKCEQFQALIHDFVTCLCRVLWEHVQQGTEIRQIKGNILYIDYIEAKVA